MGSPRETGCVRMPPSVHGCGASRATSSAYTNAVHAGGNPLSSWTACLAMRRLLSIELRSKKRSDASRKRSKRCRTGNAAFSPPTGRETRRSRRSHGLSAHHRQRCANGSRVVSVGFVRRSRSRNRRREAAPGAGNPDRLLLTVAPSSGFPEDTIMANARARPSRGRACAVGFGCAWPRSASPCRRIRVALRRRDGSARSSKSRQSDRTLDGQRAAAQASAVHLQSQQLTIATEPTHARSGTP